EFEPLPPYDSCRSVIRNDFHGDDPEPMPFLPYADDPSFNIPEYVDVYARMRWCDEPLSDPDLHHIVTETVRRLAYEKEVPLEQIDECGVLPIHVLSRTGQPGVLFTSRQIPLLRQCRINTPGASFPLPTMTGDPLIAADPFSKLASIVNVFCPNLNCVTPFCERHVTTMTMPLSAEPAVPAVVDNPCSAACFKTNELSGSRPLTADALGWTIDEFQMLKLLLDMSPSTTSCDLAVICRKPCNETYHLCSYLRTPLPSSQPQNNKRLTNPRATGRSIRSLSEYFPIPPCGHQGPCDSHADPPCLCEANGAACEHACRCSLSCRRRIQGCRCGSFRKTQKTCFSSQCPCYAASRECSPLLCVGCHARSALICMLSDKSDMCRNTQIQRGKRKHTEVKPSRWGLGLFMCEPAAAGDLICEYLGELIYEPTAGCRDIPARHRGRNYLFDANPVMSVDSSKLGNESRYINHAAEGRHNCNTKILLVNGDHYIGIFARRTIKPGEEVTINYGPRFFVDVH
ncbi:SET domain-containing protein, partial [Fistulina hepatica ATCC 64428]